jgi:serine phosphatase RsbU (regulator of sigma subunit)
VRDGGAEFAACDADSPIGLSPDPSGYREATLPISAGAIVVAFTDGLVERRGEVIDVGLARLRELAMARNGAVEDLVGKLAEELTSREHQDDTAIVAVQWLG